MAVEIPGREGEDKIRKAEALIASGAKPHIVKPGPDGKPMLFMPDGVTPYVPPKAEAGQAQEERRYDLPEDVLAEVKRIIESDQVAATAMTTIIHAFTLVELAKMKLIDRDDVTDIVLRAMVMVAHERTFGKADIESIRVMLKKLEGPMPKLARKWFASMEIEERARRKEMKEKAERLGKDGLALPTPSLRKLFKHGFWPCRVLVLQGPQPAAVREACRRCAMEQHARKIGRVTYLAGAIQEGEQAYFADKVVPVGEWSGIAAGDGKLRTGLNKLCADDTLLLVIESLDNANPTPPIEGQFTEDYKASAVTRLFKWASRNLVGVIVGDCTERQDKPTDYGDDMVPRCKVALKELDAAKAEPGALYIGDDPLALRTGG